MNKFLLLPLGVFFAALLLLFQNCLNGGFETQTSLVPLLKSDNGGGYSGLQNGQYFRMVPDFTCQKNAAALAALIITPTAVTLTENKDQQCAESQRTLNPELVDWSIYQNHIIGYKDGIFEGLSESPTQVPSNLVEVWCRDTKDETGIEALVHFDRESQQAVSRIYYAQTDSSNGGVSYKSIPDFQVVRMVLEKSVSVKDSNGFSLIVFRDQPSDQVGLFNAQMDAVIDGQKISRPTYCRLGGTVSPHLWPAKQVVDVHVNTMKMSPDLNSFAVSAFVNGRTQLYTGEFSEHAPLKKIATHFGSENLNINFSYSADGRALIYELNENHMALGLFAIPLIGTQSVQLNPSGKADVNSQPFAFNDKNSIVFSWGVMPNKDLYVVNADGSDLLKITPPLTSNEGMLYFDQPLFNNRSEKYVVVNTLNKTNFSRQQFAVAIDGSGATALPQSMFWTVMNGYAIGSSSTLSQIQVLNLQSGSSHSVPSSGNFEIAQKSKAMIRSQVVPLSQGQLQVYAHSLQGDSEATLCDAITADQLMVKEIEAHKFVIVAYLSTSQNLTVYQATTFSSRPGHIASTSCRKLNTALTTNPRLNWMNDFELSPDKMKILVTLYEKATGANELIYIPLNGKPSILVNMPTHKRSNVYQSRFLADSRRIIFHSDAVVPGVNNIFLWTAPE